uniref:PH domain-containing protein n=1 Tax=Electrophorus electricus TaxID=8005 RepID=A0A4W4EXV9_ELEEL
GKNRGRRRKIQRDLGHGDCEGWLWKKKDTSGYFTPKWKKYWFVLKDSDLYWYTNQNDEKAEGFINLPEFRIDRAIECRRKHAFKACHPKIKSFFFATDHLEEMNRWMNRLGLAAIGYTPDDPVPRPDEGEGSLRSSPKTTSFFTGILALHYSTLLLPRHFSSGSTFSHSSAEESHSSCRSNHCERRSWQDLIETPVGSTGQSLPRNRGDTRSHTLRDSHAGHMHGTLRPRARLREEDEEGVVQQSAGGRLDPLEELFRSLEQASLSAVGHHRPSTQQEFRRSFVIRCNDPATNERLHRIRALRSTLKAKEEDLAVITQVLDDPCLTSRKFREWKQRNLELFSDICKFSSAPLEPPTEPNDLSPLSPTLLMHTHSFIETHV